ncbi:hypothetical protein GCM10023238_33880 [Streptomyces heliomycini]
MLKAPVAVRNLRRMREGGGEDADGPAAPRPDPPTVSRRGALGLVGGGSLLFLVTSAGRSFDAPLRETAVLTPHGGPEPGSGPGAFQINKTAAYAGIRAAETNEAAWRLAVTGPTGTVRLGRAGPARHAVAQRRAAHRLRGGLVHLGPVVAGRTAAGPRGARRARRPGGRVRGVAANATAPSGAARCAPTRSPTRVPCSPCSSTARN